jgi:limonene-1,2-epoxide hydrolase
MDRRKFIRASGTTALAASAAAALTAGAGGGTSGKASIDAVIGLISDWKRKDIDAVLARVTDDIVWYTHVGSPPKHGKLEMRAFLEPMAAAVSDIRWRIYNHAVSGNRIFLEGADDFVLTAEKRRVAIPYMGIMTFRGPKISEWRDYFDRALFDKLKAGEP